MALKLSEKPNLQKIRTKPLLKWAGGKSGLLSQLLPFFPNTFNRYFEPFLGAGAVFFTLNFKQHAILNDSNQELINFYEIVRDDPWGLMKKLDEFSKEYSEQFYYFLRALQARNKLESAARTLFLNKTGFNGLYRQNLKGQFNVPFGKRLKCPALYEAKNLLQASDSLGQASLMCQDFQKVINFAGPGDFVYCDPPYDPVSKTSSFHAYQPGGFSQNDQRRLKDASLKAQARGATVVVSNSSSAFIHELYADCDVKIVTARRAINSKSQNRGPIGEVAVIFK